MSEFRFRKKTTLDHHDHAVQCSCWPSEEHMSHIFVIQYFRLVIDSMTIYGSDRISNDMTLGGCAEESGEFRKTI